MRLTTLALLCAGLLALLAVPALADDHAMPASDQPMLQGITYVTVTVSDQDAAAKWYTETLGMTITMDMPYNDDGDRWLSLAFPGQSEFDFPQLVLYKSNPAAEVAAGFDEVKPVNNIVISVNDCAGMQAILEAAGATIVSGATDMGYGIECLWKDADGNMFTMVQPTWSPGDPMPDGE